MANNLRVVIAAAGTGSRMKSNINKQYMLLKAKPVLYYSVMIFSQMDLVEEIIIVTHPDEVRFCQENIVDKYSFSKVSKVIPGGSQRQDSVWKGLQNLSKDTRLVAVHDGARPLIDSELILKIYHAADKYGAAIPGALAKDTLKTVDENGFVIKTLDRTNIIAVQTPQIFNYSLLAKAYQAAYQDSFNGTDDASLYEKYIGPVKLVNNEKHNLKITIPEDLVIAEQLIQKL